MNSMVVSSGENGLNRMHVNSIVAISIMDIWCIIVLEHIEISPKNIVIINFFRSNGIMREILGEVYVGNSQSDIRAIDGIFHIAPLTKLIERCLDEGKSFITEKKNSDDSVTVVLWREISAQANIP